MNMRLRLPIALALVLGGSHAYALGLGQIEVKSSLNQPLVAEIPVLVGTPGEADDLHVKLAAPDAFTRVGLERPTLQATNLQFSVHADERGRKVIRITTPEKVTDPFLSFLLEADWGKGRMLREYTVLLDPPSMVPVTASAPARTAALPEPEPAAPEPLFDETPPPMATEPLAPPQPILEPVAEPQPEPAPAPVYETIAEPSPEPAPAPQSYPSYGADTYGPVSSGDTLWSIATRARPDDSVTVNQMMLAILRANPEAFIDNNINRLKKGAVLRMPAREEATVMAAAEAATQVREQMQAWGASSVSFAQPADASASAPGDGGTRASSRSDSRLELTPPRGSGDASASQSGASADGAGRELRAELTRSREEVNTLSQENVELKSRVSELETLQAETRRLLELKDSELAAAQRRLGDADSGATDTTTTADDNKAVAALAQEPVSDESVDTAPQDDAVAEDAAEEFEAEEGVAEEDVADEALAEAAEPVSEAMPLAEQPAETALAPVAAPPATGDAPRAFNPWIVGGGAAVLLGLIGLLLSRRRKKSDGAAVAAVAATPAVAAYEPDAHEADLIEALSRYPEDLHLHLDLLQHYADSNEPTAFEMAAEAMHAQVQDPADPTWQQALALGRSFTPGHPLFSADDAYSGYEHEATESEPGPDADETMDFEPVSAPTPVTDTREVDWNAPAHGGSGNDSEEFDNFEFDAEPEFEPQPATAPYADTTDETDYASGDDFSEDGVDSDVAATKLELARAYLDMGDAEGARGMLEEVLIEGNADQRQEAETLLAGIL